MSGTLKQPSAAAETEDAQDAKLAETTDGKTKLRRRFLSLAELAKEDGRHRACASYMEKIVLVAKITPAKLRQKESRLLCLSYGEILNPLLEAWIKAQNRDWEENDDEECTLLIKRYQQPLKDEINKSSKEMLDFLKSMSFTGEEESETEALFLKCKGDIHKAQFMIGDGKEAEKEAKFAQTAYTGAQGLLTAEHRINLCDLACKSSSFVMVYPWEAKQKSYQRTLTVLSRIQNSLCKSGLISKESLKVMLLCGSDLVESFSTPGVWIPDQVSSICRDFGIVCIRREGKDIEKILASSEILTSNKSNIISVDEIVPNQISSSKLRECLRRGLSVKYLTSDEVIDYIKVHNLYTQSDDN